MWRSVVCTRRPRVSAETRDSKAGKTHNDVKQLDNVGVLKLLHDRDLRLEILLVLLVQIHLLSVDGFDGDRDIGGFVVAPVHMSKRARADSARHDVVADLGGIRTRPRKTGVVCLNLGKPSESRQDSSRDAQGSIDSPSASWCWSALPPFSAQRPLESSYLTDLTVITGYQVQIQ